MSIRGLAIKPRSFKKMHFLQTLFLTSSALQCTSASLKFDEMFLQSKHTTAPPPSVTPKLIATLVGAEIRELRMGKGVWDACSLKRFINKRARKFFDKFENLIEIPFEPF